MDCSRVWDATLAELQLQIGQATFDQWLRGTTVAERDGVLEVAVGSERAQEWLEGQLRGTIERSIARLAGRPHVHRFLGS